MTDAECLKRYVDLVPFLAEVCGPACEIVVHDVTNPECSLIAIQNNLSGRVIGDPMTDFALDLLQNKGYEGAEYMTNYCGRSKSKNQEFLSSTYYIKNEGRLVGLLCVNKDLSAVQELTGVLNGLFERFNLAASGDSAVTETLDNPVASMIHTRIEKIIAQYGISPSRMSIEERVRIVHRLDDDGVLMMKGAVSEIASCLQVSVPTIYRYLKKKPE